MTYIRTGIDDPDLSELLEGIHYGLVGLPNFQRDFDWSDSDVRSLLATVLNAWPMGSLLLIDGDKETEDFYSPRPFERAPQLQGTPETIVLDGQQRLTALYTAFYDAAEQKYAVKIGDELDWSQIDTVDAALRTFKRSAWDREFSTPATQWAGGYIPLTALRAASDFYAWRDEATHNQAEVEKLSGLYRDHLAGLHRYRVPALRIDKRMPPPAVARIFERVNRTGRRLGVFDLMVAKSFTTKFNLRVQWELAKEQYPDLEAFFKDDGTSVLQIIALRALDDVRSSSVLQLTPALVHDSWSRAASAMADAIAFAKSRLGVHQADWLPYGNILVVLGALAWEGPLTSRQQHLDSWFWKAAFSGRYAVGSNTTAVTDFRLMRDGTSVPESNRGFGIDVSDLVESTKQSSGALHRAWLCAMAANYRQLVDLEEEVGLGARSVLDRSVTVQGTGAHLLSLGFCLTVNGELVGQGLSPFIDPPPAPTHPVIVSDIVTFLRERARGLCEFLNTQVDGDVSLLEGSSSTEGLAD